MRCFYENFNTTDLVNYTLWICPYEEMKIEYSLGSYPGYRKVREKSQNMKILVDADACPVVAIVEAIAEKYSIPVILLCDTNHVLESDYSEVKIIGAGADAVDFALVGQCEKGDIVVTQDYGVAAMILGKGAYGIHQSGKWYTDDNIDRMLMERHMAKKAKRATGKHHLKGPSKRTEEDDKRFAESLERLVVKCKD